MVDNSSVTLVLGSNRCGAILSILIVVLVVRKVSMHVLAIICNVEGPHHFTAFCYYTNYLCMLPIRLCTFDYTCVYRCEEH